MVISLTIILSFGIFTALLHLTGLVLITRAKDRNINGNQKYLIIALSLTELAFVTSSIIFESIFYVSGSRTEKVGLCFSLYNSVAVGIIYYFVMFAITLDRFLELRLNIKYHLYWNKKRTKNTLFCVSFIVNLAWIVILLIILSFEQSILISNIQYKLKQNFYTYFLPVINTIFVIFATIVYSYIFLKLCNNRRKEEALRKQLGRSEATKNNILRPSKYRVPFWIILTFILFCIVPDILQLILYDYPPLHEYIHSASYVLYRIGYIADAIIYIFNLNYVKVKLREFKRNNFNNVFLAVKSNALW